MLYRNDSQYHSSQYIFIDWERMDACKSPDDKDARGRRCGARATSYKKNTKSVRNLGKSNLSKDRQSRLTELREKKSKKNANEQDRRRKAELEALKIEQNIDRRVKAEYEALKNKKSEGKPKKERKFGVIEGGGKSNPNFIKDPAEALKEAKRRKLAGDETPVETEIIPRDLAMRAMTAKAATDKALSKMKETVAEIEKRQKARKSRTRSKAKKKGFSVVEGGKSS